MSDPNASRAIVTHVTNRHAFLLLLQNNPGIIIVKLGAPWCGPCKRIAQDVHAFFSRAPADVLCADLNVDENTDVYAKFRAMRMVDGIPTLLCFLQGNLSFAPNDRHTGGDIQGLRNFFRRCEGLLQTARRGHHD